MAALALFAGHDAKASPPEPFQARSGIPELLEDFRRSDAPHVEGRPVASEADLERLIILLDEGVPADRVRELAAAGGASVMGELRLINAIVVAGPKSSAKSLAAGLRRIPGVSFVGPDRVRAWLPQPSPPQWEEAEAAACGWPRAGPPPPAGQRIPWGIERVKAPAAWASTRGQGVKVAVIDTGIDLDHPDLSVAGGFNVRSPGDSYDDDNGHGTHMAGIIAAKDNDIGVAGVAPEAAIFAVKAMDSNGRGLDSHVIEALQWCVENGMDIANLSFGTPEGSPVLEQAVSAAAGAGLAIVAAVGNTGGRVNYPAAYPDAMAVGASNSRDGIVLLSNHGPELDFVAPGTGILSTSPGGSYRSYWGTSMAAAHVTGLAALAASSRGLRGGDAVREALAAAAEKLPEEPDERQGAGIPTADRLLGLTP